MSKACQSEPPPMDRVSILVQTEADGAEEHTTAAPYYESPWTFTENMKEDNTGQTCAGNSTEEKGPRWAKGPWENNLGNEKKTFKNN